MPLTEMSPNIQEVEAITRKRSHDEFSGDAIKAGHDVHDVSTKVMQTSEDALPEMEIHSNNSSPLSSPALTDADSSTPARISPCPLTPTKTTSDSHNNNSKSSSSLPPTQQPVSMANPSAKRKRLTPAEKQAKEKELQEKKKEKEEKAMVKAEEKAKQEEEKAARLKEREEEKAARLKEREEKRKKKEEEDRAKAQQRDEKKRKKEEEQQRLQEEKDKKARSQKTLTSFFKAPATPKKPAAELNASNGSPLASATPSATQPTSTPYQKMFKPFFVRENMRVASPTSHMDDETRAAKSKHLDDCIANSEQGSSQRLPFEPTQLFRLPSPSVKRGRLHHPVKHIMELVYKQMASSSKAGTDETNRIIQYAKQRLANVPVKIIAFSQDVRPPYYGTVTYQPFALGSKTMRSLACKPVQRILPLEYDFDSEAEWQEEEGEDVDMDDDEEELDEEDDMDEFLDDSEDAGLSRRIFVNTIEPESTGICFEDDNRVGPSETVLMHKMEFMHESILQGAEVDPWSTEYWDPEPKTKTTKAASSNSDASKMMPPPPAPSNAFEALTSKGGSGAGPAAPGKLVKAELMDELKQTVLENKALSKIGIIDFVFQKLKGRASRAEVANTIVHVAEKTGSGRTKEWSLKEGHGLGS